MTTLGHHGWELVHLPVQASSFAVSDTYRFERQLVAGWAGRRAAGRVVDRLTGCPKVRQT